jgi:hypothetical protein
MWAGHAQQVGEKSNAYRILFGRLERMRHCAVQHVDQWIIFKWISDGMEWCGID